MVWYCWPMVMLIRVTVLVLGIIRKMAVIFGLLGWPFPSVKERDVSQREKRRVPQKGRSKEKKSPYWLYIVSLLFGCNIRAVRMLFLADLNPGTLFFLEDDVCMCFEVRFVSKHYMCCWVDLCIGRTSFRSFTRYYDGSTSQGWFRSWLLRSG